VTPGTRDLRRVPRNLHPGPLRRTGSVRPSGRSVGRSEVRSLPVGVFRRDATVVGRARGQVLVKAPRVSFGLIEVGLSCFAQASANGSILRDRSRARGGDRATGLRDTGSDASGARKPKRASARARKLEAGTDLRREQSPEVAGHRDLLVLRAGERDVRNGRRASAPSGVRLCGGERLWRVKPHGRHRSSRSGRAGGSKPSRG
jgi:hypothetical protein